jgi:peroxiredoxin Q/BCP
VSDSNNSVRKLYGVPTTLGVVPGRVTYVIDKKGIIKHIFSSQFHPAKHAKEAISALKKIEAPLK